jgi:2-polyprenyl-3-methyl-5-hydroxy-6-metoxy-1,4-benzoquinol methylase
MSREGLIACPALSAIDPLYDKLLESPRLDKDPWSRTSLEFFRPRQVLLWEQLSRHLEQPRETIVDVGCHNGFFLRLTEELGFSRFIGVDYFPLAPEVSYMEELNDARLLRANFNAENFLHDLADDSVDCVSSTEVLEHVYHHPVGYLAECWRVLRRGGLLLLSTPNPCTIARAVRLLLGRSVMLGDLTFARTPKVTAEGEPLAVWDVHFREYRLETVRELVGDLPDAAIVDSGYIANGPSGRSGTAKNLALSFIRRSGLGRMRLIAATEFLVVRKG